MLLNDKRMKHTYNTTISIHYYFSTHVQKVLTVHDIKQMQAYFHTDTNYNNTVHIILLDDDYNITIQ